MMVDKVSTTQELLRQATSLRLYEKLVLQLNKDLLYANIDETFPKETAPEDLKKRMHEIIYRLVHEKFADYLNLLYIIDVSEDQVKALEENDTFLLSEKVVFLILKREWQKVWFRTKY